MLYIAGKVSAPLRRFPQNRDGQSQIMGGLGQHRILNYDILIPYRVFTDTVQCAFSNDYII